jgi:hypothetical protein
MNSGNWPGQEHTDDHFDVERWVETLNADMDLPTLIIDSAHNIRATVFRRIFVNARRLGVRVISLVQSLRQLMPEMRNQSDYVFSLGQADDAVYNAFVDPACSRYQWENFVRDHRAEALYVDCRNGSPQKMPLNAPRLERQLAEQQEDIPQPIQQERMDAIIMHLNAPYLRQEEDQEPEWRRGLLGMVDQPGDPQCTICIESVKCVALGCSHTFCLACVRQMDICAMCRAPIRIAIFFRL